MKGFFRQESVVRFCLVVGGAIFALVLGEMIADKIFFPQTPSGDKKVSQKNFIIRPNLQKNFYTPSGKKKYSTNSNGIRGDEFSASQNYHILVVGASATECLFLDDEEAWPYLAQRIVNRQGHRVWIGNVGKSGLKLSNHIADSVSLLRQYPFIDAVAFFVGINDLSIALANPQIKPEEILMPEAVPQITGPSLLEKTAIWRSFQQIQGRLLMNRFKGQDAGLEFYKTQAKIRQQAVWVDELPDLSSRLYLYKLMLNLWVDLTKHMGIRVILVTQPTKWMDGLNKKEEDTLWFGWAPAVSGQPRKYFSVKALEKAMDMFNQVMRDVCKERNVECLDIAKRLPKDPALFFDDCHFNASGSFLVAQLLAEYLTKEAPVKLPSFEDPKKFKKA